MILEIKRFAQTEHGVFGNLLINYQPFCYTLEDCWLGNKSNVSCIPSGEYNCTTRDSRFGETYEVQLVPGRGGILFHAGNLAGKVGEKSGDTDGCILLGDGLKLDESGTAVGIFPSKSAMKRFFIITMMKSPIPLKITNFF